MKTNIPIISKSHCSRKRYGLITKDFFKVQQAQQEGCVITDVSFTLLYPVLNIFDLSNFPPEFSSLDLQRGLEIYHYLKKNIRSLADRAGIHIITGKDLKTEISICSQSNSELLTFKKVVWEYLLECNLISEETLKKALHREYGLHPTLEIGKANNHVSIFYKTFKKHYKKYIHNCYHNDIKPLNLGNIYHPHPIWSEISSLGENKLFALGAGLPIGLGYFNSTNDPKIYFTEIHRNNDPNMLKRIKPFDQIYPQPPENASWVILDKAYTAGTILEAKTRLSKTVSTKNIITVALFPKSLNAILRCDYFVYACHLIKTNDIKPHLSKSKWHIDIIEYIRRKLDATII